MTIKTPITDADSIRALACQALAGLARSETVRQIISKLTLFTSGQLQSNYYSFRIFKFRFCLCYYYFIYM